MNNLTITEYKEQRVLTTNQIAEAYETDGKVISKNFTRNKDRYVDGKHFICLEGEEKREFVDHRQFDDSSKKASKLYLWTEKGALLHAKSLNTDRAWEVYDYLVDNYFEKRKPLSMEQMMRVQLGMVDEHENRISNLENNMVIDYGQQQVLKNAVNRVVVMALGGKESNAYKEVGKKVFSEINHAIQDRFSVNSRNNIPKLKFDEAVGFVNQWIPSHKTVWMITGCNAQMNLQ